MAVLWPCCKLALSVNALTAQCRIVAKTIQHQAHIQKHPELRWVAQSPWAWLAFALVIIINIFTIFDIDSLATLALICGFLHLAVTGMLIWAYFLNLMPIDIEWYRSYEAKHRLPAQDMVFTKQLWTNVNRLFRAITYWSSTRVGYYVVYLFFSIIGVSVSLRFFAFHLFDICLSVSTLGFVVQAISTNLTKLLAAILLILLMIYSYMLIGQSAFRGLYVFGTGSVECTTDTPYVLYHIFETNMMNSLDFV